MKPSFAAASKPLILRLVFFVYLATVLGATLAPLSGDAYDAVSGLDKLVHVALFGGVASLLCWNLSTLTARSATGVFAVTTAFAAAIEVVQGRLWYRSGDLWDLLAGALGALLGIVFGYLVMRVWLRLRKDPS
jgi:VanZ family protein